MKAKPKYLINTKAYFKYMLTKNGRTIRDFAREVGCHENAVHQAFRLGTACMAGHNGRVRSQIAKISRKQSWVDLVNENDSTENVK